MPRRILLCHHRPLCSYRDLHSGKVLSRISNRLLKLRSRNILFFFFNLELYELCSWDFSSIDWHYIMFCLSRRIVLRHYGPFCGVRELLCW